MSHHDTTAPRPAEAAQQRSAPFARKLGFTADHQRLLDAALRGRHQIERRPA